MILTPPNTNFFNIFNFKLHYYSLCIFTAILVGCFFLFKLQKSSQKIDSNVLFDFIPVLIISSVIGARLYYVILSFDYFKNFPSEILMLHHGGLSIHGAFLGGIVSGLIYFKLKKLKFLSYADIFCTVFPLGQAIGRFGNFFNQEAFGLPIISDAPVKLYVSPSMRPVEYSLNPYFHPVFLYEAILDFILFFVLLLFYKKTTEKYDGLILFLYIFSYSVIRIILEFNRLDTVRFIFGLPFPVVVSFIGVIVGIFGILYSCMRRKSNLLS